MYPLEPKRQQTGSEGVNPLLQLAVRPTDLLVPDDQGLTICKALDYPVEVYADRIADKWRVARAVNVAKLLRHVKTDTIQYPGKTPTLRF